MSGLAAAAAAASFDSLEPRLCLSASVHLSVAGTYAPPAGTGSAEIVTYDPDTERLFVISAIQQNVAIVDVHNPNHPKLIKTIDVSGIGGPNSVAVKDGVVAVALENAVKTSPGKVAFYTTNGKFLTSVTVGVLPDMLTFSPDGKSLLVANEGEPSGYNTPTAVHPADNADPEGSVSIVSFRKGLDDVKKLKQSDVTTAGFRQFNSKINQLRAAGIRIYGPNATVAQDLEPEYITVSADSRTAWVTLQENNAIAVVDIDRGVVTRLLPLGYKNHNVAGNGLDAGEKDGGVHIKAQPLLGMYEPDSIASYKVKGQTYLVMANEGDAREWDGFVEATRITKPEQLDPAKFPNAAALVAEANFGRIQVTTSQGAAEDGDAEFEKLYSFGARSFSIRDGSGRLIFDSGDEIERVTAAAYPAFFNASNDNNTLDSRSDDKGPEPEGVAVGEVRGRNYAFIGLERVGGIMVYDITDPRHAEFVQYINNRDFTKPARVQDPAFPADPTKTIANPAALDLGPEGLTFVPANQSPTGVPLLVVANEISGTVTVYNVDPVRNGGGHGHDDDDDDSFAGTPTFSTGRTIGGDADDDTAEDDLYGGGYGIFA